MNNKHYITILIQERSKAFMEERNRQYQVRKYHEL